MGMASLLYPWRVGVPGGGKRRAMFRRRCSGAMIDCTQHCTYNLRARFAQNRIFCRESAGVALCDSFLQYRLTSFEHSGGMSMASARLGPSPTALLTGLCGISAPPLIEYTRSVLGWRNMSPSAPSLYAHLTTLVVPASSDPTRHLTCAPCSCWDVGSSSEWQHLPTPRCISDEGVPR